MLIRFRIRLFELPHRFLHLLLAVATGITLFLATLLMPIAVSAAKHFTPSPIGLHILQRHEVTAQRLGNARISVTQRPVLAFDNTGFYRA